MFSVTAGAGASGIAYQLGQNSKNLQRSLQRLSTMQRINSSADDPGGLALSMKLGASIRRIEAGLSQISNTSSFLQTQDGVLGTADDVLARMDELAASSSTSVSTSDQALYQTEFADLQTQLDNMMQESFNGISLFKDGGSTSVDTTTDFEAVVSLTGQTMGISQSDMGSVTRNIGASSGLDISSQTNAINSISAIDSARSNLAQLRAINGSEQNRIGFATDLLSVNKQNLEAANSRVLELDYASEVVNYTKYGIIQDSNIALLAQANTRSEKILKLLE